MRVINFVLLALGLVACGGSDSGGIAPPPVPGAPAAPGVPGATNPADPSSSATPQGPETAGQGLTCVGALEGGELVALDPATGKAEPLGEGPNDEQLTSFGIRGRELFFCSSESNTVARFDLDKHTTTSSRIDCTAVTADSKFLYVLGEDGQLFAFAGWDAMTDKAQPRTVTQGSELLGSSASGVLTSTFGRSVAVIDPVTGAQQTRKLDGLDGFIQSLTEHGKETFVVTAFEQGVVSYDAAGKRTRRLFEGQELVGISCVH